MSSESQRLAAAEWVAIRSHLAEVQAEQDREEHLRRTAAIRALKAKHAGIVPVEELDLVAPRADGKPSPIPKRRTGRSFHKKGSAGR